MATSASGINFTGLASGVDTSSIVTQLMSIERAPLTRMSNDMSVENARKAALQDISTKLLVAAHGGRLPAQHPVLGRHAARLERRRLARTRSASPPARPKASYQIQVKRLATGEVWAHNATSGVRDFGAADGRPEHVRGQDHDADRA